MNSRNRVDNVNSVADASGGNSADYLAARIKRDRPDIAARTGGWSRTLQP
jgi:hypothetical protein